MWKNRHEDGPLNAKKPKKKKGKKSGPGSDAGSKTGDGEQEDEIGSAASAEGSVHGDESLATEMGTAEIESKE